MRNNQSSYNRIERKLNDLRRKFARHTLQVGLLKVLLLIIIVTFLIVVVEGFRYFKGSFRSDILFFTVGFSLIFLAIPIVYYFQIIRNRIRAYDDYHLARRIGADQPEIKDDLLNALQLRELLNKETQGYSSELIEQALERIARKIEPLNFDRIIPSQEVRKSLRNLAIVIFCLVICIASSPAYFKNSMERLLHPGSEYPVKLPFSIESTRASSGVLGGDSVTISFQCQGRFPHYLTLDLQYPDYTRQEILMVDDSGRSQYLIENLRHDLVYSAYYQNHSPFKPWRRIGTPPDTIRVINRPEILYVKSRFIYPEYTGLPAQTQETKSAEFNLLSGTKISLEIRINKEIKEGHLSFASGNVLNLATNGDRARGEFIVKNDDQFEIIVADEKQVTNINPIKYRLSVIPDAYPTITMLSPKNDLDLNADMVIPLGIRISDDFGFTRAAIRYRVIKKYADYQEEETEITFPLAKLNITWQEVFFQWQIGELSLGPEDAVEFRVDIYDNDNISGPKKASTDWLIARFPSLNELFSSVNEQQDEIYSSSEEVLKSLETTKKVLDEISRELLKKPELKWEQKKQLEEEMKKTREAGEKITKLSEQLDDLIEKSRENQLFDAETLEKLAQVQEAFQDIMTPEMREALDKLQAAIEKMDPKEVQKALNNFKTSQEQFSQELDRLLKIFRRIQIEQNIDELVRRFADLSERQRQVANELGKTAPNDQQKLNELAQAENAIKNDTEIAQDIMKRTAADMAEFPMMPNKELQQLIDEMQALNLPQEQSQASSAMRKGDKSQAEKSAQNSQQNLQKLLERMEEFRTEFQRRNMADVMTDFRRILNKTMQLSYRQEELTEEIKNTPRQSDQIMDIAVKQSETRQNLSRLISDLIDLSGKTFGVSPRIGKNLGQSANSMNAAIAYMEERDPGLAALSAENATASLNMTALELMAAMQELQKSGSASGFENYLQQLQELAGMQQGLNEETQMLGLGSPGDQGTLQQLAARQQQIRQSLEKLRDEIQGQGSTKQSGDLGGIAKDMDEVIKDLENNQVLRRTLERQQRILSLLLDAQKSLRTQDFKEERQSKTGQEIVRESPDGLPSNLGERRTLLQENLEKALRDGYSKEYENLIRRYFEELSKESVE